MPISLRFLPDHILAYVRYEGRMGLAESTAALAAFAAHPADRKGMKHLVDPSAVTDWERDFFRADAAPGPRGRGV